MSIKNIFNTQISRKEYFFLLFTRYLQFFFIYIFKAIWKIIIKTFLIPFNVLKKIGSGLIFSVFASVANILIGKDDEFRKHSNLVSNGL